MAQILKPLETTLAGINKGLPPLPKNFKNGLVQWMPWLSLIAGVASVLATISLWRAANAYNRIDDAYRALTYYTGIDARPSGLTAMLWVAIAVYALSAVLYLLAFKGLKAGSKKDGWDLAFMATFVTLAYGVIVGFFTWYGDFGTFLSFAIGVAVSWYFLFQIRDHYKDSKTAKK